MEVQVQELIDKIKKDGLDAAARDAAKLKEEAEANAKQIVDKANKEAAAITAKAKSDAERTEQACIAAVGQASRNVILSFKGEIQALLDRIIANEAAKAMSGDALKTLLPEVLKSWAGAKGDAVDLLLNEGQLKELQDYFGSKLSESLKAGVELKSDRNLAAGFRIASKDGAAYYDFSAEAVADLLSAYLNPKLAETLKETAQQMDGAGA
jgi:V/A-type H+-transporting ATPase subunit E